MPGCLDLCACCWSQLFISSACNKWCYSDHPQTHSIVFQVEDGHCIITSAFEVKARATVASRELEMFFILNALGLLCLVLPANGL